MSGLTYVASLEALTLSLILGTAFPPPTKGGLLLFCVPWTQGERAAQALGGLKTFFWGPGKQGWSSQMDDQGVAPL